MLSILAARLLKVSFFKRIFAFFFVIILSVFASAASAIEVAVAFRDVGYGTFGGSQLQNIGSPNSLLSLPGLSKVEFVQDTASGRFEAIQTGCNSQGNDVAVTVRITADTNLINGVGTDGAISFLGCVNWLDQPGGKVEGFGFMLPIGSSFTIDYKSTTDITFTRTDTNVGTNMFADLRVSGGSVTYLFDGTTDSSFIGSANFKPSSLVDELNKYYAATGGGSTPLIELVKSSTLNEGTVTYTYRATNTGNVALTDVSIVELNSSNASVYSGTAFTGTGTAPSPVLNDPQSSSDISNGSTDTDTSDEVWDLLEVGDTIEWTATYDLTQADKDAGGVTNQAIAIATESGGTADGVKDLSDHTSSGENPTTTDFTQSPSIAIVKSVDTNSSIGSYSRIASNTVVDVDADGVISVGDRVYYDFSVTNTGDVTLSDITLSDADATLTVAGLSTIASLTPGVTDSTTFTPGAYIELTQAHIDAGEIANQATITASSPSGTDDVTDTSGTATDNDTETLQSLVQSPLLKVTKTVDDSALQDGVRVGDTLTYTIKVENLGNVTIKGVSLEDTFKDLNNTSLSLTNGPSKSGDTGSVSSDAIMDVGDEWTYTATFELTQDVIDVGGVENIAVVSGFVDTNGNGTKDIGESEVTAESKVGGNTSADGDGTPTQTGFPGEVTGTVRDYLKGVESVTVYLLKETSPGSGVYDYVLDPDTHQPISTTTDANGEYSFVNLPTGVYGVEFDNPNSSEEPTAKSKYEHNDNRITGIDVGAGEVEVEQDAFFIDPSGTVYNSSTYAPIQGAVVSLYHQIDGNSSPTLVPNTWLNTTLGDANEKITASDGEYVFYLDPTTAQDGIFSLEAVKDGYTFVSTVIMPLSGPHDPGLGGGFVQISSDTSTFDGMDETYYTSFDMVFTNDPDTTSNGVVQNHLPMDPVSLIPEIEDDLMEILKDDLSATMTQQSRQMSSFAKGALSRLRSETSDTCAVDLNTVEPVLFDNDSSVVRADQAEVLDQLAEILATCENASFEIAGHTDSNASDAYNIALSQSRVNAIRAALIERGIEADRLVSNGYGESRPIADNATSEGRALNRRVEFVSVAEGVTQAAPCEDENALNRNMTASITDKGVNVSGALYQEDHACGSNSWRIMSGTASYMETTDGMAQGMANLSVRREELVASDRISGRFVGVYASQNAVTGLATGEIRGFGLNGGLYGAQLLQDTLYLDYYLGAAAGRHFFDLEFARTGGPITTTGHYDYTALFAGAALSGEMDLGDVTAAPRIGVDLAYSPGGDVAVTAARSGLEDIGNLSLGSVSGLRTYAEIGFLDLSKASNSTLSFTPKAFCHRAIGSSDMICGYGGTVELSSFDAESGLTYGFKLTGEKSGLHSYSALEASYSIPLSAWLASGGAQVTQDGNVGLQQAFAMQF